MTDLSRVKLRLLFVALIERIITTNETTVDNQELRYEKRKSNKNMLVGLPDTVAASRPDMASLARLLVFGQHTNS